jgi:hypothetical protein
VIVESAEIEHYRAVGYSPLHAQRQHGGAAPFGCSLHGRITVRTAGRFDRRLPQQLTGGAPEQQDPKPA